VNDGGPAKDAPLILVIDDEATQRLLSQDCLESAGFRVEVAADGTSGLEAARRLRPAAILLDVVMPEIDGFAVCQEIRADKNLARTPVALITGLEDTEAINQAFRIGATDFLTKPVTWSLLPYRVRFMLRATSIATELRAAKEQAEAASSAKSSFLSNMSNKLRTPLNTMIAFSELMRAEQFGPIGAPQYKEYAQHINSASQHLLALINNILDLAKSESGKLTLQEVEVLLPGIVAAALHDVKDEAQAKSLKIVDMVRSSAYRVLGDEQRLFQIVVNLLSNAVKFTPANGTVRVYLEGFSANSLALVFEDSGPGIPAEELPRILEPLGLVAGGDERTGTGISTARALARLHGGDLFYESKVGQGTKACLVLPPERILGASTAPAGTPIAAAGDSRRIRSPSGSPSGGAGRYSGSPRSYSGSPRGPSGAPRSYSGSPSRNTGRYATVSGAHANGGGNPAPAAAPQPAASEPDKVPVYPGHGRS
jgi:signal transduction histidine kinase